MYKVMVIDDEGNLVSDQSGAIVADALEEPTQMENEEDLSFEVGSIELETAAGSQSEDALV